MGRKDLIRSQLGEEYRKTIKYNAVWDLLYLLKQMNLNWKAIASIRINIFVDKHFNKS